MKESSAKVLSKQVEHVVVLALVLSIFFTAFNTIWRGEFPITYSDVAIDE